ncbi:hypothetical protein [Pectobacterium versatile]|uniref:hypothetical protein n=1 Tax=Pectobacterium versatile TaxID=2488639 RepID=UPI0034D95620
MVYELTKIGKGLSTVLKAMKEWADSVSNKNLSQALDTSASIAKEKMTETSLFR